MNNISLNLIGKIDAKTVEVLKTVDAILAEFQIPYVIVGATARDLVLHFGHGAKIQRATSDVDFAIQVVDWETFNQIKNRLCEVGFRTSDNQQRLYGPQNESIDIVPFGGIEDKDAIISWPPSGDIAMNVLGFSEACENADRVLIEDNPEITVPVATPAGLLLLKFVAWTDRVSELRMKDALDIKYLLANYDEIPSVVEEVYDSINTALMESYDWDLTLSTAHICGVHADKIATGGTREIILKLKSKGIGKLTIEILVHEMSKNSDFEYERNAQLLHAFYSGFEERQDKVGK